MTIETKDDTSIFPQPHRNRAGFTQEEVQDIKRFFDTYDLDSVDRARVIARLKEVRAARALQRREAQAAKS
jgi:hypothetical protein